MIDRWESLLLGQEYPEEEVTDLACPPEVKAIAYRNEEYHVKNDPGKTLLSSLSYKENAKAIVDNKEFSTLLLQTTGIALLNLYLQINYCGPKFTSPAIGEIIKKHSNNKDGSKLNVLAKGSGLLLASVCLFSQLAESNPENFASKWWLARASVFLHHVSCGDVENIQDKVMLFFDIDLSSNAILFEQLPTRLQGLYLAERARAQINFNEEFEAKETLQQLAKFEDFKYTLTGARSVRTQYQTKSNPHLIVLATSHSSKMTFNDHHKEYNNTGLANLEKCYTSLFQIPKYDTQEENIQKEDANNPSLLAPLDAIILLLEARRIVQTNPFGSPMTKEEIDAYTSRVLANGLSALGPQLYIHAIWERAQAESQSAKATERSVRLIEDLLGYIDEEDNKMKESLSFPLNLATRFQYIHQLIPMARWELASSLADKYMSLGDLEPAGKLFEKELNNPVNAAMCLAATGKRQEAQTQLEGYLSTHENDARAWSMLGDVTNDSKHWSKAWELAKYPAAKRAWAEKVYKIDHNSEEAMQHFRDALLVDGSHFQAWYLYGCIAIERKEFDIGVEAFTRCAQLDDSSYQSWSNLATCLLNQGKPRQAFVALRRAISTSQESPNRWKIWENYCLVARTLDDWVEVVRATKEMIQEKLSSGINNNGNSIINFETINAIVDALIQTKYPDDDEEKRLSFFQKSGIDLLCNYLPKVCTGPASANVFILSGHVEKWRNKPYNALECYKKAADLLLTRQQQAGNNSSSSLTLWNQTVDATINLVNGYIELGPLPSRHGVVCKDAKSKALQAVTHLLTIGHDKWHDSDSYATLLSLKQDLLK